MQSKDQLIDSILQINRSTSRDWLAAFDVSALRRYLDHLQLTLEPRGGASFWIREPETPAVVTRKPAA